MSEVIEILKNYSQFKIDYSTLLIKFDNLQLKHNALLNQSIHEQNDNFEKAQTQLIQDLNNANEINRNLYIENERLNNELKILKIDYNELLLQYKNILNDNNLNLNFQQQLLDFLSQKFNIDSNNSIDYVFDNIQQVLNEKDENIDIMRERIKQLEMSTDQKEIKLRNIIETLHAKMSQEQKLIDTELVMYNETIKFNDNNTLNLEDFIDLIEYDISGEMDTNIIPFYKNLSRLINSDIGDNINEFEIINENINIFYHAYTILIIKLLSMYSKSYIRNYMYYLYDQCDNAIKNRQQTISLPALVHPQTFQINSLYYLLNRYNSKCYNPDRVADFSNIIFDLLKPEYRRDSTKALNLFQPGIGQRYNSIQIYTPETIKKLDDLKSTISSLLE